MVISFRDEWDDTDPQEDNEEQQAAAYHATLPLHADATGNDLRILVQTDILEWFYNRA